MIRSLISILLVFSFTKATAQTARRVDDQLMLGVVDQFHSKVLDEDRSFWVYVPDSAADSTKRFPVVYLLDGSDHFYSVAAMMRQLGEVNGNTLVPESIVVGVLNTNRTRDLTPSTVSYMPGSGGADQFVKFLETELIPYVEQKYHSTGYRTLIGHSWGGLFTLHSLLNHTALFDNYISIDPTIRWNGGAFFEEAKDKLKDTDLTRKSLYLAVANRLPTGLDLNTVRSDTNRNSQHMRTMLEFAETAKQSESLNFDWKFYPDDNHMGVPLIAAYDGLRHLFPWYHFDEEVLFEQESTMSTAEFIEMVKAHFSNISDQFGYRVIPDQRLVDRLADAAFSINDREKAFALYQLNVIHYAHSPYPYEALGDYYRRTGEAEKAKAQYETSLAIQETARVQRKLQRLNDQ